ncbi:RimK family alpha-L-glutamate ligase [Bradyrhizobium sp. 145]|uniref:RimK family alpha-L-glutamate ligase n=1 Tax=Bradyrhizobium sp. 145 TaxID=2782621 RepID=UPI001FF95B45|nr:RimK family alpha-L-glutamate ligase [Bradyrhizobium sp. 145]MCK1689045.1 RimK family alpha-L-glutamate ligase [Bradyrhizobium sp. 145]
MRLLILTKTLDCLGENDAPIANAFRRLGWEVILGEINAVAADDYRIFTRGALVARDDDPYHPGEAARGNRALYFLDEFQLVWVMTQPLDRVARDVWQMLWLASQKTGFVNSIEGLMFLNTKHALGFLLPSANRAFSFISNDFSSLWKLYQEARDQRWVAKPPNTSSGQNVFLLPPNGPNVRTILQCLTGNADVQSLTSGGLSGFRAKYAILQHFIPEVAQGEKRVIVVRGKVVAWHGREVNPDDHRSNITQGGKLISVDLHSGEIELAELIGKRLLAHGINFFGMDMAYPYVLELELTNPGGLYDTALVSGVDYSDEAAELIVAQLKK